MEYKRVLTVQDLSCLGQCSGAVALPVLSAFGFETCLLPTALLSAHTAFREPYVRQLTDCIAPIAAHWKREGVRFDAILTGYLGSVGDIEPVLNILEELRSPGSVCIVDPAMADGGRFYKGLDGAYAEEMRRLCLRADILLPNRTEAAFLTGLADDGTEDGARKLLLALPQEKAILTGAVSEPGYTGFAVKDGGKIRFYRHEKTPGRFFGTGDLFAACLTGFLLQGKDVWGAAVSAAEFTAQAVSLTARTDHRTYGLKFEPLLRQLGESL